MNWQPTARRGTMTLPTMSPSGAHGHGEWPRAINSGGRRGPTRGVAQAGSERRERRAASEAPRRSPRRVLQ
eukprot:6771367-Alexandrium_andersonii.AAC.1